MNFLLDTNVLLFYVRDSSTRQFLEEVYQPFSDKNEAIISIVSVAEILVLAKSMLGNFILRKADMAKNII